MNIEDSNTQRPVASMTALVEQISQSRSNSRIQGSIAPAIGNPARLESVTFERVEIAFAVLQQDQELESINLAQEPAEASEGTTFFDPFADFGTPVPAKKPKTKRKSKVKKAKKASATKKPTTSKKKSATKRPKKKSK